MPTLFFNSSNIKELEDLNAGFKPCQAKNLRLMLWAGDGKHGSLTDIMRLPNYDVYLCAGWQENLQENIDMLTDRQTLCVLDIKNEVQLALFHHIYDGCFELIDSDYEGNTPSLPISDYTSLLTSGGSARHIEGINSIRTPYENLYGMLELFAPILPAELLLKRLWCSDIMELSARDNMPPSMVWSSPDLNHSYYRYVKDAQKSFEEEQKRRCGAWPRHEATLQEQWSKMSTVALTCSTYLDAPIREGVMGKLMPHMSRFNEFLDGKIEQLLAIKGGAFSIEGDHYTNEVKSLENDILSTVNFKQTVLKMLMISVPEGMKVRIECYPDDRYP